LKPGDPKHVEIIRWLFDQFVNRARSLCSLAGELNARKVPAPCGARWYVRTVGKLLRQRAYRGDFAFNVLPSGQFFRIDPNGEVAASDEINGEGKVFFVQGRYKPIIDPELFDKAQQRLESRGTDRSRRKREGYALTGILVCDHCGRPMYGVRQHGDKSAAIYRCGTDAIRGRGACGHRQVREDVILPFILRLLGKAMTDVKHLVPRPPEELVDKHKQVQRERDELVVRISRAEENLLFTDDPRTRQSLDLRITVMRDELDKINAKLSVRVDRAKHWEEDLQRLSDFWSDFDKRAVSMPVSADANMALAGGLFQDRSAEESAVMVDPRLVNETLLTLGTEVRLRWKSVARVTSTGKTRRVHKLVRGRFRLGQRKGTVPRHVLEPSVCRSPIASSVLPIA
jgi:hypothetical protein